MSDMSGLSREYLDSTHRRVLAKLACHHLRYLRHNGAPQTTVRQAVEAIIQDGKPNTLGGALRDYYLGLDEKQRIGLDATVIRWEREGV